MKNLLIICLLSVVSITAWSQVPTGFNYQGVARDASGVALANQDIAIQLQIMDEIGTLEYSELHSVTTDQVGLFSFVVGTGTADIGAFDALDWSYGKDVSIGIDPNNGSNFEIEIMAPLQSVPYAQYSKYAENIDDADADATNEIQQITIVDNIITLSNGGSVAVPMDGTEDADADPTNEIQQLTLQGDILTLSNGGSVNLPTSTDADPTNEIQNLGFENNILSLTGANNVDLSGLAVTVGEVSADVPAIPVDGQLYFDETNNRFFIYHEEGWTEILLGNTVDDIYAEDIDSDNDGILNGDDNCPNTPNTDQIDDDNDGTGDVCDDCVGALDQCGVCNGAGPTTWCLDADGDGLGISTATIVDCDQPMGYVDNCTDDNDNCIGVTDACGVCNGNGPSTWCQDMDEDGLGNPDESIVACDQPTGYVSNCDDDNDSGDCLINGIHAAFAEFDSDSYSIIASGSNYVLTTDGLPNHTSPYWSSGHPLDVEPTVTSYAQMAPGNIDNFNGSYSLTISQSPQLASSSSSTGLGAIGLAVSGSVIYNDEEGPNIPLDNAVGSLDYTAAHTGPQSYHYHLEPHAWSEDDDKLIGIIADGFFLYGRKCASTGGYPSDLDASGGHTSSTQHSCGDEYHYHIQNELYLNEYYILFPGDYQGTPSNIQ